MGRAIVNFTTRGIRNGVLSADQYLSEYNTNMIRATEANGERLDHEFPSTWQATLRHRIVDAIQDHSRRAGTIQEQLGAAILHVTQAQTPNNQVGISSGSMKASQERTRVIHTRAGDVCHGYIGES
jgi:hypothetical protein